MTIAGGIILIMIGAILTWAVDYDLAGIDINVVGVILMLGGLAGTIVGIMRLQAARRAVVEPPVREVHDETRPLGGTTRRVREERYYNDPPAV
ncbi:DUF6458 family protein [Bailinhaonella thermotolerans]|uniref:DUF6458 domain-containing protein n=1 Tax=Bailinhaonella thermotolerans TaxID=1070861 RepID=A0A3A4A7U5_9ACTN|nr:DUF6458 family protein [Bailinhaonella thermotolerans]RJL25096.1 hypothetical protein D5H75_27510 [Bailinhaonella thermotolerans]